MTEKVVKFQFEDLVLTASVNLPSSAAQAERQSYSAGLALAPLEDKPDLSACDAQAGGDLHQQQHEDVDGFPIDGETAAQDADAHDESKAEAESDVQQAYFMDLESLREESYREGLSDGRKRCQECQERMDSLYNTVSNIALKLEKEHKNLWKNHETEMVKLALAIAKKATHHELMTTPDVINSVVSESIQQAKDREIAAIRLNPDDADKLDRAQLFSTFSPGDDAIAPPKIITDPHVSPGGCILETNFGDVDGTIETRWQGIEDSMLENK